jgi:hypothetical protein
MHICSRRYPSPLCATPTAFCLLRAKSPSQDWLTSDRHLQTFAERFVAYRASLTAMARQGSTAGK